MITAKQALAAVLDGGPKLRKEITKLESALGRVLARDVHADFDQPPFHRVAMDGIAVQSSQLIPHAVFNIIGTVAAGACSPQLPDGNVCFEIMTGAVLPLGADIVIRYEDLAIEGAQARLLVDPAHLSCNYHVKGSDYRAGDMVLKAGTLIRSTTAAILASVGQHEVEVFAIPKIAILSTGDELVDIRERPGPEQIRWSNGISLVMELLSFGFHDVSVFKCRDNEAEILQAVRERLQSADVLLLTGGVSAGKYDFVPKLLKACGVEEVFHKVAQRPGKPLWFGRCSRALVFGLPGNPVSCLINLRKFVIPLLQQSVNSGMPQATRMPLKEAVRFNKDFTYYCLIKVIDGPKGPEALPLKGNGSGDLYQLRDSDGFMELRPDEAPFNFGHVAEVYLWGR